MSAKPAVTISSAFGDVFTEGTIQFKDGLVIGWRAIKLYPDSDVSVSIWWSETGKPIQSPDRLINVRKIVIPMLAAAWAPTPETYDA